MRLVACLRHLRRCDSGAVAVEFAMIGLVAISIFMGIVEFGRALHVRNELSYAADIAARKILTNPSVADSELETAIRSSITFGGTEDLVLTFGSESADGVAFRTLLVQQPLTLILPVPSAAAVMLSVGRRIPIL